jgi:catalase (peroxidase I)
MFARLARLATPRVGAAVAGSTFATAVAGLQAPPAAECLFGLGGDKPDWTKLKKEIIALCDDEGAPNPSVDGAAGSLGGGGYVGPMLVRLAWHSAGSYGKAKNDGGSNGGTIRFTPEINHGGNAGLKHAIGALAPIKENNPAVSWADLIIYAGVVAIENMGGPQIGFTPGRKDAPKPDVAPSKDKKFTPDDRLVRGADPRTPRPIRVPPPSPPAHPR